MTGFNSGFNISHLTNAPAKGYGCQFSSDGTSYINPYSQTYSRLRTDSNGNFMLNWQGKCIEQTFSLGTEGHNPFLVYDGGQPAGDINGNYVLKSYDEWLMESNNVVKDPRTGAPVIDPKTGEIRKRSWMNMSIEKWSAILFRMIGCTKMAETAMLSSPAGGAISLGNANVSLGGGLFGKFRKMLGLYSNPTLLAQSIEASAASKTPEALLKQASLLQYDTRMQAGLWEFLMPSASRQGPAWKWPVQRVKSSFQNFIYNNAMGKSFIERNFAGMFVPVIASVGLVRAFCCGYERASRNGSSIWGALASGFANFCEEAVRTVVSYKMADMAFYTAKLGLNRLATSSVMAPLLARFGLAAMGGPLGIGLSIGITVASCLPMAVASVWGNQLVTGAANRLKYALKMGYPT